MRYRAGNPIVAGVVAAALIMAIPGAPATIAGGPEAAVENWPYVVRVLTEPGAAHCAGVLVTRYSVVTAARCVEGREPGALTILAGRRGPDGKAGITVLVAGTWTQPEHPPDKGKTHDIAVLTLARPVPVPSGRLPKLAGPGFRYAPGTKATILGWGRLPYTGEWPDTLRKADVVVGSGASCAQPGEDSFADGMVCASRPDGGEDTCRDGSGGPVLVGDTVIGIVAAGPGCARPDRPGRYTEVASILAELPLTGSS